MKKILLMIALMLGCITINAQTAIQTSRLFDNVYVGITGGAMTPLDFNSTFPLNSTFGLKLGKEITPVFGLETEGLAVFNDNHFGDFHTGVKATNVGGAFTLNLSNAFAGYNGKPRAVEFKTNTGLGWLHTYGDDANSLSAKTALDVIMNFGHNRAVSMVVSPGVYWNMNRFDRAIKNIKFNKNAAQFSLMASFIYHFKTSNGTHHFKKYDITAMNDEINSLKEELSKKPKEVVVEKVIEKTIEVNNSTYVFFAKNSATLTDDAKKTLDKVQSGEYDIDGYASPEGSDEYNVKLSQRRADAVAEYLKQRNITVNKVTGNGVAFGNATNRVVIVNRKQ